MCNAIVEPFLSCEVPLRFLSSLKQRFVNIMGFFVFVFLASVLPLLKESEICALRHH